MAVDYSLDPYKWGARRTSGANYSTSPRQPNRHRTQALSLLTCGVPMVYAMGMPDDTIKIGCSADLARRRQRLHSAAEVLAFAPGDFDDEARIHARLRGSRAHGHEFYHRTPEVMAVVNELRRHFGLPALT